MSLATRCPSCGTVFRVVPDQLKVSEGWVRCGRCSSVFDAAVVLFDIDSGAPVRLVPSDDAAPVPVPPAADAADQVTADQIDVDASAIDGQPTGLPAPHAESDRREGKQEPRFDASPPAWLPPSQPDPALETLATQPADARVAQPEEPLLRSASTQAGAPRPSEVAPPETGTGDLQALDEPTGTPAFLRPTDQTTLGQRPVLRRALWLVGVLLLALGLLAQALWIWRDTLAAQLPASEPALQALCRLAGCQVQPLRRIDALAVDRAGLSRLEASTLYRLQLVLRNRADTALKMPALDLSLTDAQGQLVTRRVLQMAELGAPQAQLQAGQELPIMVLLSTDERRIGGYAVELFYP